MKEKLSRREFLQTACISVGALSLSGAGVSAAAVETDKSGGNKQGLPSVDVLSWVLVARDFERPSPFVRTTRN